MIDSYGSKIQIHRMGPLKVGKISFRYKPLEQEPCDDCISRQAAIDALGECPMNWMDSDAEITAVRDWIDTVKTLKRLPSVTPQPKTEVLDKIRAEIVKLDDINPDYPMDMTVHISRYEVLNIINKYRAESEVEE